MAHRPHAFVKVPDNAFNRAHIVRCLHCNTKMAAHLGYYLVIGRINSGTYTHDPKGTCTNKEAMKALERELEAPPPRLTTGTLFEV